MTTKITEKEIKMVLATGKMIDLGLYEDEIAEILEQPIGKILRWIWFHEMNKAIEFKAKDLSE